MVTALASLLLALAAQDEGGLVIRNVTVIEVVAGTRLAERGIRIQDGRIETIRPSSEVQAEEGDVEVDGSGGYLIPGLWDMHVRTAASYETDFPLFVANGVLGVRNMQGSPDESLAELVELRERVESKELLGPRVVVNGTVALPEDRRGPNRLSPQEDAAVREAVHRLVTGGADFIEVPGELPRSMYFIVADEARGQHIPFAGPVPWQVAASEASEAGQSSFEAMIGLPEGCCDQENKVTARCGDAYLARQAANPRAGKLWAYYLEGLFMTQQPALRDGLIATLARNHTWQCPTLVSNLFLTRPDDVLFFKPPDFAYVPRGVRGLWLEARDFMVEVVGSASPQDGERYTQMLLDMVRDMHRWGVGILAGSDLGNPYVVAGFGLHDELELLVRVGLTPADALRSATISPARFLGREVDLGTVEEGKLADLVLLDANPLVDIKNARRIRAVIAGGRLLDREALDGLLELARSRAR